MNTCNLGSFNVLLTAALKSAGTKRIGVDKTTKLEMALSHFSSLATSGANTAVVVYGV
jgi:hypothetical protein